MRRARTVIITITFVVVLVAILLAIACLPPLVPKTAVSVHLISYTNYNLSTPDTNVFVYPGRGEWLEAQMVITNEGNVSIAFAAWNDEPRGQAYVETDQGPTNGYMAPPFTGDMAILLPGEAITFWVTLPTNTLRWQCNFEAEPASVRQRAARRIIESGIYRMAPVAVFYPLRWVPDKRGPGFDVKSGMLEYSNTISH
jgi:hypothetical protein